MKDRVYAKKTIRLEKDGDVLIARAEIASIGDQHPYFSLTGDLYDSVHANRDGSVKNADGKTRWLGSCGAMGDTIVEWSPELARFKRWHLTSTDGPMYYLGNAIYHAGFVLGMEKSRNLEHLKSTIVYGAVAGDYDVNLETFDAEGLKAFLTARFPALMQQFKADMVELFGEIPDLPEIATEVEAYKGTLSTPHNREVMRQKKRQELIDDFQHKREQEQIELDGKLWAFDRGLDIDNLIYYSHKQMFSFGWRQPVTDAEKSTILDVISEFPFEYEIKTKQGVLSGRE